MSDSTWAIIATIIVAHVGQLVGTAGLVGSIRANVQNLLDWRGLIDAVGSPQSRVNKQQLDDHHGRLFNLEHPQEDVK
jgi:hypothetical protein